MAPGRSTVITPFDPGIGSALSLEEVRHPDLPLAVRGYDRGRVDRLLARVADAYALVCEQSQALRERLRSLETEFAAAQGEAQASARAVAELMQRSPTANVQPFERSDPNAVLQSRLERAEAERDQALVDLRQTAQRASELGERLAALENARHAHPQQAEAAPLATDDEAARLLVAAARAADDIRDAARARALRTLQKARELSALVHAQIDRERAALAEVEERRGQAERDAQAILANAHAEAARVSVELEEGRRRGERDAEEIRARARADADRSRAEMSERRAQAEYQAEQILAQARAEAARVVSATEGERHRVRELLTGALASLEAEAEAAGSRGSLVGDLSSRLDLSSGHLDETAEPTAAS